MSSHKTSYQVTISHAVNDGTGIAYFDDKTIFVDSVLADEQVLVQSYQRRRKKHKAFVLEVLKPAPQRIPWRCAVYNICGGCALQHLSTNNQIILKKTNLLDLFAKQGVALPKQWLPVITGASWHYRRKARLTVRFVEKKQAVLIGFREKHSRFVTQMDDCPILDERLANQLPALKQCLAELSIKEKIAQIEVAISDDVVALILRHLAPLSQNDEKILLDFAKQQQVSWYLQAKGIDSVVPLLAESPPLYYHHHKHNITIGFAPTDFTQVNFAVNEKMVDQAMQLLDIQPSDNVLDLFCGLGNFSLVMARYAGKVTGVDFDENLIKRAQQNSLDNDLNNTDFFSADLSKPTTECSWYQTDQYNKALIDPARAGASTILAHLPKLGVQSLLYVSCHPETLALDSKTLLTLGYQIADIGMVDMFAQTKHIESMVLFERCAS